MPTSFFGWALALAPIAISLAVAAVALFQYRVAAQKLRLDLYNRRFQVYVDALNLYQGLTGSDIREARMQFDLKHLAFIKSFREARFLFKPDSGVYEALDEMHKHAMVVIFQKENFGNHALFPTPQAIIKANEDLQLSLKVTNDCITKLEGVLGKYLNFHKTW